MDWMCKLGAISQEQLKIEVKLLLSANRKSYAALIGTTMDDLQWPCYWNTAQYCRIVSYHRRKKLYLIVTFCSPLANFISKAHSFCGLHNFAPRRGIFKNAA